NRMSARARAVVHICPSAQDQNAIANGECRAGLPCLCNSYGLFWNGLDGLSGCGCIASMKEKIFLALIGASLIGAGCVPTVTGRSTGGVPFIKDAVEGHYERPLDQVFEAAKEVVKFNGTLINEGTHHTETNTFKTVEGKVNQRSV